MVNVADPARFRFGPLERRGILAGLRSDQLVILGVAGVSVAASLRVAPTGTSVPLTIALSLVAAVSAFVPIQGRTAGEWAPVLARWFVSNLMGRRFVVSQPVWGFVVGDDAQPEMPRSLRGVTILAHPVPGSDVALGVVKDRRAGTFTGILSVKGRSFALLDGLEKERRLSAWAGILAGLARDSGVVHRLQWVERAVPDPGDELGAYLKDNISVPIDSLIARSYLEVVDAAGPVTQHHETFVALQIDASRSGRAIKAAGGGDDGACEVLRRELTALATKLTASEVAVEGALTPRLAARAIRTGFEPSSRPGLVGISARSTERVGTSVANAGPMSAEASWSAYRSNDAWHRTYWIAEWPRVDADPDFLAPLLLRTERTRTVSLTMEPIGPLKAIRAVESARTSAAADEELRRRAGFVTTTRRAREQDALAAHERDLSDGHAFYRFAGFVTVTAFDEAELDSACGEIEEAAGRSFLDLRALNGQQDIAFTYSLPLGRGLR